MESGDLDCLCPAFLTIVMLYLIILGLRQLKEEKKRVSRGKAYQDAGNVDIL